MSSLKMSPVQPVRPVAPYIGGKRALAKRLTALIETIPHDTYAEPFIGMGGIFLRRRVRPKAEVINDISEDVTTLFLILQEHYAYFVDHLRFRLTSRSEFERLANLDPSRSRMTDLNRAARFLYLQRTAFGGKVHGRNFGVDAGKPGRFNVTELESMLAELHERLAGVVIERLTYADFIRRYDRPGTLFYLDPPYFGCERDYGPGVFSRDDFAAMADQLAGISGRFLLSINDAPEIREIFSAFAMIEIRTTYTLGTKHSKAGKDVGELIITNIPDLSPLPANDRR